jgi:hypothetical protein
MEYLIKFEFTCHKNSHFIGKSGEVSITTEIPIEIETIKNSDEIKYMIGNDMALKTGMDILSVVIIDVSELP